jgi:pyrroloquinoline quinone (PQQ) biosynthesis protein C
MTGASLRTDTLEKLSTSKVRKDLVSDLADLTELGNGITHDDVLIILGQWFHPLHYFPSFLSRLISVAPNIEMKTYISKILWQELGEGYPKNAHEEIYIETMQDAGFDRLSVANAAPFDSTRKLVKAYEESSSNYLNGLGFLYGTEVVDLLMVSTIGNIVRQHVGQRELTWVDIHVKQEPDHIESSNQTLRPAFAQEEQQIILENAEQMWIHWIQFFETIRKEIS